MFDKSNFVKKSITGLKKAADSSTETELKKSTIYSHDPISDGDSLGFNLSGQVGDLTSWPVAGVPGTTNTVGGRDFLELEVSRQVIPYIQQGSVLRGHFDTITMSGPTMSLPKFADAMSVYSTAEGNIVKNTTQPTTTIALIARPMSVSLLLPRELTDDAPVDIMKMLIDGLIARFVLAEEEAFLLGDINTFTGTANVRGLFDGLTKLGEHDSSGSTDSAAENGAPLANAAGADFNPEFLNGSLEHLDLFGQNPEDLLALINRKHARAVRGDGMVTRQYTNFGNSSVFRSGRLGRIYGMQVAQTRLLNSNYPIATADDYYWAQYGFGDDRVSPGPSQESPGAGDDTSTAGNGERMYWYYATEEEANDARTDLSEAIVVHKDACVIGDRQDLEVEMSPHVAMTSRSYFVIAHERVAFAPKYRRAIHKIVNLGG